MDFFAGYETIGALAAPIVGVAAYFALQQLSTRLADDVYDGFKNRVAALARRVFLSAKPVLATPKGDALTIAKTPAEELSAAPRDTASPVVFETPRGRYNDLSFLNAGELSNLYNARLDEPGGRVREVVIKNRGSDCTPGKRPSAARRAGSGARVHERSLHRGGDRCDALAR